MHFFYEWGLFLLDTATIVIAILIAFAGIAAIASKQKKNKEPGKLTIKKINKQFSDTIETIQAETLDKNALKSQKKTDKQSKKTKSKAKTTRDNLFIIDFEGDIKASAVTALRECVTGILLTAKPEDHILLRLESPGGSVNGYGLAASQLQRLRDANLNLTVAVDKVAASGGYMMACIANTIISAPFAIIGSIGVVFQLPNFSRLLQKNAIDFELLTAGEYKRTLTVFGENTDADREKAQADIEDIQTHFKEHVSSHRPQIDIDQVATGEHWLAKQAMGLKLVDELKTSDDFILNLKDSHDIFLIEYRIKEKFGKKLAGGLSALYTKITHGSRYEYS